MEAKQKQQRTKKSEKPKADPIKKNTEQQIKTERPKAEVKPNPIMKQQINKESESIDSKVRNEITKIKADKNMSSVDKLNAIKRLSQEGYNQATQKFIMNEFNKLEKVVREKVEKTKEAQKIKK